MRKEVVTARNPEAGSVAFPANSSSVSASSAPASLALRMSRTAAIAKSTMTTACTGFSGSRPIRPPNATATTVCTRKAAHTPIQTRMGR